MTLAAGALISGLTISGASASPSAGFNSVARAQASGLRANADGGGGDDTMDQANQYAVARTAPGGTVSAGAFAAAEAQAAKLPLVGGSWTQLTNTSDNAQPIKYTDPVWSNAGAGFRNVSGRVTALAADGSTIYMGAADGGVWKTTDGGQNWTPIFDNMPTISIGALAVNPADHSLWVGTGEANTNADSYSGQGVYRSSDGGASFSRVGGSELSSRTSYRITFDGLGHAYVATSAGLWRRPTSNLGSAWTLVLKPDPNPNNNPYRTSFITDVAVRPNTNGAVVVAADGWRGAGNPPADTAHNGFYVSTDHGLPGTFSEISVTGAINGSDIGRTTFAYSSNGQKLYAIVESPSALLSGAATVLQGVYLSSNGDPQGPWTLIADANKLCASGSGGCATGVDPGVQAWYNESLAVDPANDQHIVVGLEEVYQSFNAGTTFTTISSYWNYAFPCDATNSCPAVTHPDQHAALMANGKLFIGNDGGVYSRPLEDTRKWGDWTDLNNTLHTLQYYDAEAGASGPRLVEWGGLQDNGTTVQYPNFPTITPAGGDGGDVIVNPANAKDAVGEYVDLNTYMTTDGGHTFTTITPSCFDVLPPPIAGCDPSPRFIAPMTADVNNPNHWVIGGEFVWNDTANWATVCNSTTTCNWHNVHDTGTGHSITALAVNGNVTYAGWCGNCNIGGATPFATGIDTNFGGHWHTISAPNLPDRYLQGLTVDPANAAHVYAVYNGFSRRWIPNAGVGHVFESTNGGATWTDISVLLPDVPSDALVFSGGKLMLATDIGAFIADAGHGSNTAWSRFGAGLPNSSINNLRQDPGSNTVLAATHGRGLWRISIP